MMFIDKVSMLEILINRFCKIVNFTASFNTVAEFHQVVHCVKIKSEKFRCELGHPVEQLVLQYCRIGI